MWDASGFGCGAFQSRYRAAFHFRLNSQPGSRLLLSCFHLVIERLFISGTRNKPTKKRGYYEVSISLSSGFSFQAHRVGCINIVFDVSISLSSGFSFQAWQRDYRHCAERYVSISLSSGFSFQVNLRVDIQSPHTLRFNLVIERLLISGVVPALIVSHLVVSISLSSGFSFQAPYRRRAKLGWPGFNLVIERLLISGHPKAHECHSAAQWKFQSRYRAASHFRAQNPSISPSPTLTCFNLVIERLLISGAECDDAILLLYAGFNLVIERLLISGLAAVGTQQLCSHVSISLSSGFSFQGSLRDFIRGCGIPCFNLVIERLLISGSELVFSDDGLVRFNLVIERLLISGDGASVRLARLSRFNLVIERLLISGVASPSFSSSSSEFPSRYRAASHFRISGCF